MAAVTTWDGGEYQKRFDDLAASGVDVHGEVDFVMRYDDVDDWWVHVTKTSTRTGDADKAMDFATRSDVLAELEEASKPFEQPDDRLEIPARTWIATATA